MRNRLKEIIRTKSFSSGKDIVLASGKTSNLYFNMKPTMMDAEGAYLLGELIIEAVTPLQPDYLGGMAMGAVPLVATAASASYRLNPSKPYSAFFIRKQAKDHGTEELIEGLGKDQSLDKQKIVMIEDVTTTGGSVITAINLARSVGGQVADVLTVVDRQEGAAANLEAEGITLHALFRAEEFISK